MICRRSDHAALIALGLAVAVAVPGCSDGIEPRGAPATAQSDLAFTRLLSDADAALADGALENAGRKLDAASALEPDNPDLWVAIARLRYRGGEHLTAIEAADRALELGPRNASALLMRALIVRDAHGFAASLPWFEAALAADHEGVDVWAEYAATLGDAGRSRAMLLAVRKLAEIAPGDPRVFYLQAVLAARGGENALARSLLVRSGMAARDVPAALLLDAVLSLEEGNTDSAAATLEGLAARQPANARVRELLARALLLSGRDVELVERFADDAQRIEASPYLIMLVARAHERLGDRKSAAPLLARTYHRANATPVVLVQRPGLPQPVVAIRGAASAGNWRSAQAQAQTLRARLSASADVASLAGDAALGAGDPQDALAAYSLSAQVRRPWPLARKTAFAYRRAGDTAAADALLVRHVAGEPANLTAVAELAQVLIRREDWARAAGLLDHAIRLGGGHDPALLALRVKAARGLTKPADARHFATLLAEIQPRRLALQ